MSGAETTVRVISQAGAAVSVALEQTKYDFNEDATGIELTLLARVASDIPHGAMLVNIAVSTSSGTAIPNQDFKPLNASVPIPSDSYEDVNGKWVGRGTVTLELIDDEVREGSEELTVKLERSHSLSPEFGITTTDYPVSIDGDEDEPTLSLGVAPASIAEAGATSSKVTVSITNAKTFANDETITLVFAGTATAEDDYTVSPSDGDGNTQGHQITLAKGASARGMGKVSTPTLRSA